MTISDTRRRAELRGREAVARWRMRGGVWAARLFATLNALTAILALVGPGGPHWPVTIGLAIWAAGLVIAAQRIERGHRADAVALFAIFLIGDVARWLSGDRSGALSLISIAVLIALGNAVWGTFALARVRRETAQVPPPSPALKMRGRLSNEELKPSAAPSSLVE